MKTIKGPAIFLAQFIGDEPPFNDLKSICQWAKSLGFVGVQIPTTDARFINLQQCAESKTYADELKGLVNECGLEITELSTHLQGQLVANHYRNFSLCVKAQINNEQPKAEWLDFPGADVGVRGMAFIENVIASGKSNEKWRTFTI
jgi:hypothetical protein